MKCLMRNPSMQLCAWHKQYRRNATVDHASCLHTSNKRSWPGNPQKSFQIHALFQSSKQQVIYKPQTVNSITQARNSVP